MDGFELDVKWENITDIPELNLKNYPQDTDPNNLDKAFEGNVFIKIDGESLGFHFLEEKEKSNQVQFKIKPYFSVFLPKFVRFLMNILIFAPLKGKNPKKNIYIDLDDAIMDSTLDSYPIIHFEILETTTIKQFNPIIFDISIELFLVKCKQFFLKIKNYLLNLENPELWKENWFLLSRDAFEFTQMKEFNNLSIISINELEKFIEHENFAMKYYANELYSQKKWNKSYNGIKFYGYGR